MAQPAPPLTFTIRLDGPDVIIAYEHRASISGTELRVPIAACGGVQMMPRLHAFLHERVQASRTVVPSRTAIWWRETCTWPHEFLTGDGPSPSAGGSFLLALVGVVGLGVGVIYTHDGWLTPAGVMILIGLLAFLGSWGLGRRFIRQERETHVAGHQWEVMRNALRQASRTEPVEHTLGDELISSVKSLLGRS